MNYNFFNYKMVCHFQQNLIVYYFFLPLEFFFIWRFAVNNIPFNLSNSSSFEGHWFLMRTPLVALMLWGASRVQEGLLAKSMLAMLVFIVRTSQALEELLRTEKVFLPIYCRQHLFVRWILLVDEIVPWIWEICPKLWLNCYMDS